MKKRLLNKERITIVLFSIIMLIAVAGIAILIGGSKGNKTDVAEAGANRQGEQKEEYVTTLEDGSKLNTSKELQKNKTLDGLELSNIQLKETGGITTLLADVKNKTNTEIAEKMIAIDVLDRNGAKITTVRGIIDKVGAGETVKLNTSITADISNAYNFKINNN